MRKLAMLFLLLSCAGSLIGSSHSIMVNPDMPTENIYISYHPGTLPLILTAPHGGYIDLERVPDRYAGCWNSSSDQCVFTHTCGTPNYAKCHATVEPDDNVIDLTMKMRDAVYSATGQYPHVVLNNLKRTKLDPNRPRDEATLGVPIAERAWDTYYDYIHQAKSTFIGKPGLLIDIHGHSHKIVRTEFGYLLSTLDLDTNNLPPEKTSIYALSKRVNAPFEELLRGAKSLGGLLEAEGFSAVPSPKYPGPEGNPYFTGEYTIEAEGSRDKGIVDGIMAESPHPYREDDTRGKYAKSFSKAILTFMEQYYNLNEYIAEISAKENKNVNDLADQENVEKDGTDTKAEGAVKKSPINTGAIIFGVAAICTLLVMLLVLVSRLRSKPKYQPVPNYDEL